MAQIALRPDTSGYRPEGAERDRIQSRTLKVLMSSQVFGGMGLVAGYIPAALLAKEITGSPTLAGLAAAMLSVGSSGASFPLASYMYRKGRRPGLRIGYLVGAAGAVAAFASAVMSIYPLLLIGVALIGTGNACNLAARYAAADLAGEDRRARSIGVIVWASTVGSASGSYVALALATGVAAAVGLPALSGPYVLSLAVFAIAAMIVHTQLRPDPLVVSGGINTAHRTETKRAELRRATGLILANPRARIAVAAMITAQMVMVGVMTMTPIHMDDGGQSASTIGLMMTIHIFGMYAFSPIIGLLSDRFGRLPMIAVGAVLLITGAEFAARTSAIHAPGVMVGNFLIGLGWGFGVIAGSSLLTEAFPIEQRVSVQGTADLAMSGFGATGGLVSGAIVALRSYADLGRYAIVVAVVLLLATIWHRVRAEQVPLVARSAIGRSS
ncbi:MAG: MFS transporter [Acidimicrobiia bacterium]|nr:MFS transporter [Acidimicrobiia bacterium]